MGLHSEKRGVENKAFEDTESSSSHANAETSKAETVMAEATKEEATKVEAAKAEGAKEAAAKAEAAKAEAAKAEAAKAEAAKAESTKAESTKAESTKAESTKAESTKAESTKAEAAKAESTKAEAERPLAEDAPAEKKGSVVSAKDVEAAKGAEQASRGCWSGGRGLTTNVVVLSVAYLLLFTAFKGAANLQSSVNAEGGRGTSALMAYYAAFIASSIFLPAVMIRKLGCKWTMALCAVAYAPFMAANLHAEFYTLVPGALVAGAGAGPAWCALSTYTSLAGERSARARDAAAADVEAATARLYSLFYTVYQLNQVSGNLVSSLVLSAGLEEPIPVPAPTANETLALFNATWSAVGAGPGPGAGTCGASLCGDIAADAPHPPPPAARLTWLCVVYLACVLLAAAMLAFGVQDLSRKGSEGAEGAVQPSALELLAATVKLLRRRRLLLLVPVFFFFGAEKAFVGAEFTAGYVSCVSGVASIGYVMICYGLTNSGASAAAGWLNARVGRRRLMAATVALHAALLAVLLAWEPRAAAASSRAVLFPLAALWGVVDGLWLVQINTLVSHLFPGDEEAAFSNYHLWESAGYIAAYGYSAHLCVYVKLYILAALLAGGALAFAAIELLLLRSKRRAKALCEHDA